jgi:hypothetical protein
VDNKLEFHADDKFDIVMVAVDLETGVSTPINQLTPQQLDRLLVVPENLVPAILAHMRRALIIFP